jgi:UDP-N-acetylglucosamine transferase subunit ALG13
MSKEADRGVGSALAKDNKIFLKSVDSSDMYKYVIKQATIGTAVGTSIAGLGVAGLYKFTPWFKKYTNASARAFIVFAGAGVGFSLASDWAMVHYYRFIDRPELSGFAKLNEEHKQEISLKKSDIIKTWAWDNRFKVIGAGWAATMAGILYKNYGNKHLNSVAKFGHARITAQAVTIAAVIAAFAFNSETGPFAEKYKPGHERE